ncbi:hypothetical protein, partial [Streptomyces somaliensis]
MRSSKSARTAPSAVLALLVLPLMALSFAIAQTPALSAAAQPRAAAAGTAAEPLRAHTPAPGRQPNVGTKEGEQSVHGGMCVRTS